MTPKQRKAYGLPPTPPWEKPKYNPDDELPPLPNITPQEMQDKLALLGVDMAATEAAWQAHDTVLALGNDRVQADNAFHEVRRRKRGGSKT